MQKHLDEHASVHSLEREYGAEHSMICKWVKKYMAYGEAELQPKECLGNKYAA